MLRLLPGDVRYGLGRLGGSAWFSANPAQQRHALANYAVVLGREPGDPEVERLARRAFENYGRMLVDFVLIGDLDPDEVRQRVSVGGLEHLDQGLAGGKGVILAAPHMGSWDMGGSLAGARGYPIHTVASRFPGSLDDAVVQDRLRFGLHVIPLDRSAVRGVQDALAQNHTVALLCDLEHGPGLEVDFFGRRSVVPPGPAAFALKTGAPLMPACVYRVGPGRYHVHIDPPLEPEPEVDRRRQTLELMQMVMRRFEDYIRERPDQWYAFRPVFRPLSQAAARPAMRTG